MRITSVSGTTSKNMHRSWLTKKDRKSFEHIIVISVVFTIIFVLVIIKLFFSQCIFTWPLRLDFVNCFNEQKAPASEKAAEITSHLM